MEAEDSRATLLTPVLGLEDQGGLSMWRHGIGVERVRVSRQRGKWEQGHAVSIAQNRSGRESDLPPVWVSQVLWEQSHTPLFTYYPCATGRVA